jgi:Membrane protein involved in cytochrome C biogenesis
MDSITAIKLTVEVAINLIIFVVVFSLVLRWQSRPSSKPIMNSLNLVLPLLYLVFIIGICWRFLTPHTQYPPGWAIIVTAAIGVVLSLPVIAATDYEQRFDGKIYSRPNRMLIFTLVGLFILKILGVILLRQVDVTTTSFLIYVLVIAYFTPWRLACWVKYRRIASQSV